MLTGSTNFAEFEAGILRSMAYPARRVPQIRTRAVMVIFLDLVMVWPVDTGYSKSEITVSTAPVGNVNARDRHAKYPEPDAAAALATAQSIDATPWAVIYVTPRAVYSWILNQGHSAQMPAFEVERVLNDAPHRIGATP